MAKYQGELRLPLQAADLEKLGLQLEDGVLKGDLDSEKLQAQLSFATSTNLVRNRWLSDACQTVDQQLEAAAESCRAAHNLELSPNPAPLPPNNGAPAAGNQPAGRELNAVLAAEIILDRTIGEVERLTSSEISSTELKNSLVALTAEIKLLGTAADPASASAIQGLTQKLNSLTALINQGIGKRADVDVLLDDIKKLRLNGGAADATAYHDFHVAQLAFKHVWTEAFDERVRGLAEEMYKEYTRLYDAAGVEVPPFESIQDIAQLKEFIKAVRDTVGVPAAPIPRSEPVPSGNARGVYVSPPPIPAARLQARSRIQTTLVPEATEEIFQQATEVWDTLSPEQQLSIQNLTTRWKNAKTPEARDLIDRTVAAILEAPDGAGDRLINLISELGKMLSEPYAFDVFAPNTYNFGILATYRQRWEPVVYQAGDLVATIPLAPGETRKYSKRQVVKKSRAEKEVEKSTSSRSEQSSQTSRAEAEIMRKATTATNFKMTSHGSFNIGIGGLDVGTEFATSQENFSASTKRDFHEATLKAAEDYRLERSLEVDTTASAETEETSSGEISNPNNEITVTYLFYELQRRYKINEHLHRVRPVIFVAQDVPAPHEIDEAWLIANQWVLSRVLLDNLFRPALEYLATGFAGEEVSLQVIRSQWETQRRLVEQLQTQAQALLTSRDELRKAIIEDVRQKAINDEEHSPINFFFGHIGENPFEAVDDYQKQVQQSYILEANRKAAETKLGYVDEAFADAQKKLQQAIGAFEQATRELSSAMQKSFSRRVAIDQLRVHVKQNILYYMQAIWDHEPTDQRFFRLYNLKVKWPEPDTTWEFAVQQQQPKPAFNVANVPVFFHDKSILVSPFKAVAGLNVRLIPQPTISEVEHELVEIADLDNPLGYKGNYMMFPLKQSCYLTDFMLREYVDQYFGVRDPDDTGNYTIEQLACLVECVLNDKNATDEQKTNAKEFFAKRLSEIRPTSDEIIVPTGQLFIEALPGSHPVLEDFKLLHRAEDVRKVKSEIQHAELENLRFAARLVAGERADPDVEKQINVSGNSRVVVDADA